MSIREWNRLFLCPFCIFPAAWKAYMTPSTTTPGSDSTPANSQCTRQFWSRPHSLYLFLSVGVELPTTAVAWRRASLSLIGHLRRHTWLLPPWQHQFIQTPGIKNFSFGSEWFFKTRASRLLKGKFETPTIRFYSTYATLWNIAKATMYLSLWCANIYKCTRQVLKFDWNTSTYVPKSINEFSNFITIKGWSSPCVQ
jgi:hypothetical protein